MSRCFVSIMHNILLHSSFQNLFYTHKIRETWYFGEIAWCRHQNLFRRAFFFWVTSFSSCTGQSLTLFQRRNAWIGVKSIYKFLNQIQMPLNTCIKSVFNKSIPRLSALIQQINIQRELYAMCVHFIEQAETVLFYSVHWLMLFYRTLRIHIACTFSFYGVILHPFRSKLS